MYVEVWFELYPYTWEITNRHNIPCTFSARKHLHGEWRVANVHLPEKLSRKVAPKCHILLLVSQQQVR
jgi:hypothetical protein